IVPKLRHPVSGVRQPEPSISQPLSEPAAKTGNPSGMPVSDEAFFVICPIVSDGFTRSGSFSRSILNNSHLKSYFPAHLHVLLLNGRYPILLPTESTNSPVSLCVKNPDTVKNLYVFFHISGCCWLIQLASQSFITASRVSSRFTALSTGRRALDIILLASAFLWSSQVIAGRSALPFSSTLIMVARCVVSVTPAISFLRVS